MTPDPISMSPETSQTVRRVSHPAQGSRSNGGSPRHKNRVYQGPNRASPKSLFYQQHKAGAPPQRRSSYPTQGDGANNNGSPTGFAGSKFNEAPSPELLPPPPAHWLAKGLSTASAKTTNVINESMTRNLKYMLKVPVQS